MEGLGLRLFRARRTPYSVIVAIIYRDSSDCKDPLKGLLYCYCSVASPSKLYCRVSDFSQFRI